MIENWVFIQSEPGLWTVGFYGPDKWMPESDHDNQESAAKRVNYLNGSIAQVAHPELGSGALREALQFYADPQSYGLNGGGVERILNDAGKRARAALSLSSPIEPAPQGASDDKV